MLALFRENLHKLHIKLAKRKDDHHFSIHESRSNLEETSLFNIVKPYLTFHHGIDNGKSTLKFIYLFIPKRQKRKLKKKKNKFKHQIET